MNLIPDDLAVRVASNNTQQIIGEGLRSGWTDVGVEYDYIKSSHDETIAAIPRYRYSVRDNYIVDNIGLLSYGVDDKTTLQQALEDLREALRTTEMNERHWKETRNYYKESCEPVEKRETDSSLLLEVITTTYKKG